MSADTAGGQSHPPLKASVLKGEQAWKWGLKSVEVWHSLAKHITAHKMPYSRQQAGNTAGRAAVRFPVVLLL